MNNTKFVKVKTGEENTLSVLGENVGVVDEFISLGCTVRGIEILEGRIV